MVRALTNLKKQKNSGNADEQAVAKKVSKKRERVPKIDTVDTMSDASLDTSDEEFSGVELETPRRSSRNRLPSSKYCKADFVLSSSSSQEDEEEENSPGTPEDALIPAFGRRQCPAQADKVAQPSNASA
ncbi:hypothetical protein M9435_005125 [Picochlorum sp. BPE23]|nr:hypothetical protein M9435_005125 [Picochlorum sp. BPE23]